MRFLALFILLNTSLFAQEGVWYKDIDHALANPDSVFQLQLKKGLNAFLRNYVNSLIYRN